MGCTFPPQKSAAMPRFRFEKVALTTTNGGRHTSCATGRKSCRLYRRDLRDPATRRRIVHAPSSSNWWMAGANPPSCKVPGHLHLPVGCPQATFSTTHFFPLAAASGRIARVLYRRFTDRTLADAMSPYHRGERLSSFCSCNIGTVYRNQVIKLLIDTVKITCKKNHLTESGKGCLFVPEAGRAGHSSERCKPGLSAVTRCLTPTQLTAPESFFDFAVGRVAEFRGLTLLIRGREEPADLVWLPVHTR
jgi:hypothetical protein